MNKLARFAVAGCVMIGGCCVSYESDVNKLCNPREVCPVPFESKGLSRSDRDALVGKCLGSKLNTSEGRALFESMKEQPFPQQAALLSEAASKAKLDSCPWADELVATSAP